MKTKQLLKEIDGVFIPPKKKYYFGKIQFGTPYFNPIGFVSSIVYIRKLKRRTTEDYAEETKNNPWNDRYTKESNLYINIPIIRRNKYWIVKDYFIEIGWPIRIKTVQLGWKDKFESPRFEWCPQFHVFLFKWQFCIWWIAPDKNNDQYYEQILWFLNYSNKDILKAKETWPWQDMVTKQSTWDDKYLTSDSIKKLIVSFKNK